MKEHFKTLDLLRGFAAFGVVLYHFSNITLPTIKPNWLTEIFYYGKFGVQVFFVISGFVIPYSMVKSKYEFSDYFSYLLKRYIRICPPSYIAILLTFVLYYSCLIIQGRPINGMDWPGLNIRSIFGNLTYTVPYINTSWFNPVFWTLAIEFQFYIIIGILLPIIMKKKIGYTILSLSFLLLLGYFQLDWFFNYSGFFVLGIILFLRKEKILYRSLMILITIPVLLISYYQSSFPAFIFGLVTFLIILFDFKLDFKWANYLGKISYSLYITHLSVGLISEIILKRITTIHEYPIGKIVMLLVYASITILFASLFYNYIEKPFISYSKKLSLKKTCDK